MRTFKEIFEEIETQDFWHGSWHPDKRKKCTDTTSCNTDKKPEKKSKDNEERPGSRSAIRWHFRK